MFPFSSQKGRSWIPLLLPIFLANPGLSSTVNLIFPLQVDEVIEHAIGSSTHHIYEFDVEPGRWIVDLQQLEGDLVVGVYDAEAQNLGEVDNLFDAQGSERLAFATSRSMHGRIHVRLHHGFDRGRYRLRLQEGDDDPRRWSAELASTWAGSFGAYESYRVDVVSRQRAIGAFRVARQKWHSLGALREEVEATYALALLHDSPDLRQQAVELLQEALDGWRRLQDDAFRASVLNDLALLRRDQGDLEAAEQLLDEAIGLYEGADNIYGAMVAGYNICGLGHRRGRLEEARSCYSSILSGIRATGSALHLGNLLNSLGGVHYQLGEVEPARQYFAQALEQHRLSGDPEQRAAVLNNRAALNRYTGFWGDAVIDYEAALKIQRRVGDRAGEGRALNNLGHGLLALGELERAAEYFEQALEIRRQVGDPAAQAVTLNNLATLYLAQGNAVKALAFRRRALEIRQRLGLSRRRALTQLWMARDLRALGRPQEALEELEGVIEQLPEAGDRRFAAHAWSDRGRLLLDLGELEGGKQSLRRGLELHVALEDRWGEVEARVSLADAERRNNRWRGAQEEASLAIATIEELRQGVLDIEVRGTFLAAKGRAYEIAIEAAMARHVMEPEAGHHLQALAFSEAFRARALLDLLEDTVARRPRSRDASTMAPQARLREELQLLTARRLRATSRPTAASKIATLDQRLDAVRHALFGLEGEAGDSTAARQLAQTLAPREIQALLGDESALLEIALGPEESFLWLVTSEDVRSYSLPGREVLESLALEAHEELETVELGASVTKRAVDAAPGAGALVQLSQKLLGPLEDELQHDLAARRLIVVPDGALHYVPFAALRLPSDPEVALVERHEVVHLPSASTLGVLRHQHRASGPGPEVLVFADPVFDLRDPRVSDRARRYARFRQHTQSGQQTVVPVEPFLQRLVGSGTEAKAIASLLPADDVVLASGFAAARQRVLMKETAEARIVHFATHGLIDARHASNSGLMLSHWDDLGRRMDGFLSLEDIYGLRLNAELVVLSGCRTALGKEVRGEGLVGLSRGFLQAGAQAVVASLWQVEDAATAELMQHFYRAMLQDNLTPSAALRRAQLTLSRTPRFADPFYWAGFVVQGDGELSDSVRTLPD